MPTRTATATWRGNLARGDGNVSVESGAFTEQGYTYASRFERGDGTNPDELLGAAHAACFTMSLAHMLAQDGHEAARVRTEARVSLGTEGGAHIEGIELVTEGDVPGIDDATFREYAEKAKAGCAISKALAAVEIGLRATLVTGRDPS